MTKPQPLFAFEAPARPIKATATTPAMLGVWTDGVSIHLECEEDAAERRAGSHPAYRLKEGRRYRVTIEELP